jgi:SAM-dependent methyltransferase
VSFCRRAREIGYRIRVDTGAEIGHVAEVVVTDDYARRNRDFYAAPWIPPRPAPTAPVGETAENPAPPTGALGDVVSAAEITRGGLRISGFERDEESRRHRARYAWAARALARRIHVGTVADYGCGTGYGCPVMNREAAIRGASLRIVGLDADPEAVAFGRRLWWPELYEADRGALANLDELAAFISGPLSAVTCFEVMEHLDDHPRETLAALLTLTPLVVGSVPYREPEGYNTHHRHHDLRPETVASAGVSFSAYGQRWDGTIGPLNLSRDVNPIMLFVAQRSA